jgi:hypothetical protein
VCRNPSEAPKAHTTSDMSSEARPANANEGFLFPNSGVWEESLVRILEINFDFGKCV